MMADRLTADEIETALRSFGEYVSMYGYRDDHDEFSTRQHEIAAKVAQIWREEVTA